MIEILVALAIAALLLLGLSQIFIGSKQAYSVQTALSRSQENARFIAGFLENNVRMAGYFGCGNESSIGSNFYNHLVVSGDTPPFNQRFQRPIQGFQNRSCQSGSCTLPDLPVAGTNADWNPAPPLGALPTDPAPVKGSDILVLRVLSAQSTPTLGAFNPAAAPTAASPTFSVAPVPADPNFISGGIYAIANCLPRVDIFKASEASAGTVVVAISGADENKLSNPTNPGDLSTWAWTQAEGDYRQPPNGQLASTVNAEVYKAQYMAIYVGLRDGTTPALYVQQPASTNVPINTQEIADGVESMQIRYGIDSDGDGVADRFVSAADVEAGAADDATRDANWRKVISVHVSLLMRAQDRAGVPPNSNGNLFVLYGGNDGPINITASTTDGRFRDVYETTIALRNRLSNF